MSSINLVYIEKRYLTSSSILTSYAEIIIKNRHDTLSIYFTIKTQFGYTTNFNIHFKQSM